MARRALEYILLSGLLLAWGCEQKGDATSAFNEGVDAGGRRLVPIKSPSRKVDKGMIAAAASAEEASGRKPAGGTPGAGTTDTPAITIDASTPDGVVRAYVEIAAAGNMAQMPDLLVPEQEKIVRPLAETLAPLMDAFRQLQAAWTEKFPNDAFPANRAGTPVAIGAAKYKAGNINKTSDEEATVDLEPEEGMPGKAITLRLKQIDGSWKIEDPSVPPPDKAEEEIAKFANFVPKLAEATQDVAAKIREGQLTTAKDAQEAFAKAFMAVMLQGQGGGSADGEAPPPNEAAPKTDEAPKDQPVDGGVSPQADPLDGTYTGPNQLRNNR
ncbi:MAG: hypothetical protein KA354_21730 [Phycisphaerae bacterium]|nr:hypothetical protein [Phycisphaerae bacterium]